MSKPIYQGDIDKIPARKFDVGQIKVKNKDGEIETLKGGSQIKKHIREAVKGGKNKFTLEEKLKKEGVVLNQAEKRQRLMTTAGGSNKPSLHEQKLMEKAEAKKKMRNVQLSKMSDEMMSSRQNPMDRIFGGKTSETSDHIGVQRQSGNASALAGSGSAGVQAQSGQQGVSVGSTVGPATGIGQGTGKNSKPGSLPSSNSAGPGSASTPGGIPMGNRPL